MVRFLICRHFCDLLEVSHRYRILWNIFSLADHDLVIGDCNCIQKIVEHNWNKERSVQINKKGFVWEGENKKNYINNYNYKNKQSITFTKRRRQEFSLVVNIQVSHISSFEYIKIEFSSSLWTFFFCFTLQF